MLFSFLDFTSKDRRKMPIFCWKILFRVFMPFIFHATNRSTAHKTGVKVLLLFRSFSFVYTYFSTFFFSSSVRSTEYWVLVFVLCGAFQNNFIKQKQIKWKNTIKRKTNDQKITKCKHAKCIYFYLNRIENNGYELK